MKKKFKTFEKIAVCSDGRTAMVYGELCENGYVDGVAMFPAKFSRDGKNVVEYNVPLGVYTLTGRKYARTKSFNMGWAICSPEDKFNRDEGVKICKRRFRKTPLTTTSGTFLTNDMIEAIVSNELKYIIDNIHKFVPSELSTVRRGTVGEAGTR